LRGELSGFFVTLGNLASFIFVSVIGVRAMSIDQELDRLDGFDEFLSEQVNEHEQRLDRIESFLLKLLGVAKDCGIIEGRASTRKSNSSEAKEPMGC
jgi:hypothetical protein